MVIPGTRTISDISRLNFIVRVFLKYGFDDVVRFFRLGPVLTAGRRVARRPETKSLSRPVRLRMALEELGPTFSKFGQLMASRADLFPPDYINEFQKLEDRLPPVPEAQIEEALKKALGGLPEEKFLSFDRTPIAMATIAQVHAAVLPSGERVAVKIRRPGITETIEADLGILKTLAELAEKHLPELRAFRPRELCRHFTKNLRWELDFSHEARNMELAREQFAEDPTVVIPRSFPELSSESVLVMEFLDGIKITRTKDFAALGVRPEMIAQRGARMVFRQVFVNGFFQGDPHPGNLLVLPGGAIGLLDFGMFGRISTERRALLGDLLFSIVERDIPFMISTLDRLGILGSDPDRKDNKGALGEDLTGLLDEFIDRPLGEIRVESLFSELFEVIRTNQLVLPPDLTLLMRAIVIMDGIGRTLDPRFNMLTEGRPFIENLIKSQITPSSLKKSFRRGGLSLMRAFSRLPEEVERILFKVRSGRIRVDFNLRHLEELIGEMDKAGNRLSVSILVGALVIGSAMIFSSPKGPKFLGVSSVGLVGFLVAGLLGIGLIISILRSGRL